MNLKNKFRLSKGTIMAVDEKSNYYDAGGIETIKIIKAKLNPEQFKGFLLGNIIKYACRVNHKGQAARDIEKIKTYSELLLNEVTK
jgi:hypothetical protein